MCRATRQGGHGAWGPADVSCPVSLFSDFKPTRGNRPGQRCPHSPAEGPWGRWQGCLPPHPPVTSRQPSPPPVEACPHPPLVAQSLDLTLPLLVTGVRPIPDSSEGEHVTCPWEEGVWWGLSGGPWLGSTLGASEWSWRCPMTTGIWGDGGGMRRLRPRTECCPLCRRSRVGGARCTCRSPGKSTSISRGRR